MTVRRWPDTLPTPSRSLGLKPVDPSLRTPMEVGAARVRRRTLARFDKVRLEWRMTPVQFRAFRIWVDDLSYSLLGASDDLAIWNISNTTKVTAAGLSPDGLAVDRLVETAVTGGHQLTRFDADFGVDGADLQLCASFKAAGRTLGRLAILDRNGVACYSNFDLAAGTLGTQSGLLTRAIVDRGNGWYRIIIAANLGVGVATPAARIFLCDDTGAFTYLGDVTKGFDICETLVRFGSGSDLWLPADTAGKALGASGGAAWFQMKLDIDGDYRTVECRFTGGWDSVADKGMNRMVTAEVEVRNA